MEQIGHVDAQKSTTLLSGWTNSLRTTNYIKALGSFTSSRVHMIPQPYDEMIPGTDNVAMVIHIDGHGSQSIKLDTWHVIQRFEPQDQPQVENFYDEDKPMLDPKDTMAIKPLGLH
jgi:hypothetical protein